MLIKTISTFIWFMALFTGERLYPSAPLRSSFRRVRKNLTLWGVNLLLSPFVFLPITYFASKKGTDFLQSPGIVSFALGLLSLELYLYFWHRANHEIPFLWRFHKVHHLDRILDTTTALRFHFGEVFLSALARGVVVFTLGIRFEVVVVFETLVLFSTLFHHSNLRLPSWLERSLSKIIVTPSIHWVHHHAERHEMDTNYATNISIWDVLFKTKNTQTVRTPDMPLGVQHQPDLDLLDLMKEPLR